MSAHPLSPWLDLVRSSLPAFKQFGAELPAAQSQWAQFVKSTLELGKECAELHKATTFALLQVQLGMLGSGKPARTAHDFLDLQLDALGQQAAQWKALSDQAAGRNDACIAELRQARTQDDVSFVMAGFLRDAETALRKAAGDAAMASHSASAAAGLLTHRLLDELIAEPAQAAAQAAATPAAQD
jgi:hypothetical protein